MTRATFRFFLWQMPWLLLIFSLPSLYGDDEVADVFEPTIKAAGPANSSGPLAPTTANLGGIGLGSKKASAVINNQVYHEGETKDGIQVTQIRKQEVDILINGLPSTIRMIHEEEMGTAGRGHEKRTEVTTSEEKPPSEDNGQSGPLKEEETASTPPTPNAH